MYLRKKYIIKAETIKSFTEKNQVVAPVFLKNEIPNSESNISSTKNERIRKPKISKENYHHKANSSFFGKTTTTTTKNNNKDKEKKNDEKEKPKLSNVMKKTLILGDSIIKILTVED